MSKVYICHSCGLHAGTAPGALCPDCIEALEEAANLAMHRWEWWRENPDDHDVECDFTACNEIAVAIRKLKVTV